jgi:cold shock CspA family protein
MKPCSRGSCGNNIPDKRQLGAACKQTALDTVGNKYGVHSLMSGRVKWFSSQKGYGFLIDENGTERFFGVRDVVGADLPSNGDTVSFEPSTNKRGPTACSVKIVQRHVTSQQSPRSSTGNSDKVECPYCHKMVYPRMVTYRRRADRTLCPFCGGTIKNFRGWLERLIFGGWW